MFLFAFSLILISCEDNEDPNTQDPILVLKSKVLESDNIVKEKRAAVNEDIERIEIQKARILIKEVKIHEAEGDGEDNLKLLKLEPMVYEAIKDTFKLVLQSEIPAGEYKHIKFEVHRFSSSELSQYADDEIFADFATEGRFTGIFDLKIYNKDGSEEDFTFRTDATDNIQLNFDQELVLEENEEYEICVYFDLDDLFISKNDELLDPRDEKNENDIDKNFRDSFGFFEIK